MALLIDWGRWEYLLSTDLISWEESEFVRPIFLLEMYRCWLGVVRKTYARNIFYKDNHSIRVYQVIIGDIRSSQWATLWDFSCRIHWNYITKKRFQYNQDTIILPATTTQKVVWGFIHSLQIPGVKPPSGVKALISGGDAKSSAYCFPSSWNLMEWAVVWWASAAALPLNLCPKPDEDLCGMNIEEENFTSEWWQLGLAHLPAKD